MQVQREAMIVGPHTTTTAVNQHFHQLICTKHEYVEMILTVSHGIHGSIGSSSWSCRFCGKPLGETSIPATGKE